jgi:hypothetical protein
MIWVIVISLVSFLVGLGASTGFVVMRAPAPVRPAAHGVAPRDSSAVTVAAPKPPAADTTHAPVVAPQPAPATAAVGSAPAAATPAPPVVTPEAAVIHAPAPAVSDVKAALRAVHDSSSGGVLNYRAVAKLLMNMKPVDAGHVLNYLDDTQVEGILRSLGARQAAVLLSQLSAARAAALSRRLLQPAPAGEGS